MKDIHEALDVLDGGFDDAVTGNVPTDQPNVVEIMPDESDYLWIERSYLRQHDAALSLLRTELERRKVPDTDLLAEAKEATGALVRLYHLALNGDVARMLEAHRLATGILAALEQADRYARGVEEAGKAKDAALNVLARYAAAHAGHDTNIAPAHRTPGFWKWYALQERDPRKTAHVEPDDGGQAPALDQRHTGGEGKPSRHPMMPYGNCRPEWKGTERMDTGDEG